MATHPRLSTPFFLCFLFVSVAFGLRSPRLNQAQQCRVQRFTPIQPYQTLKSEGGVIVKWNESDPQLQCTGIAPLIYALGPSSLSVPSFQASPRLAYVLQGRGLMGITIPGCVETFSSQQQEEVEEGDKHQRVQRIKRGDVIAIPVGAAHWCANEDENEELHVLAFNDINHLSNQLDQRLRIFHLAGGIPNQPPCPADPQQQCGGGGGGQDRDGREGYSTCRNIIYNFDSQLFAESLNVTIDIVSKMQRPDDRGLIVRLQGGLEILGPGQQQEQPASNGLEETVCSMKFHININHQKQADVYSKRAGKLTMVNKHRMPILRFMDMSLEKGDLSPDAMVVPHWTMNGHSIMYVIRGEAQVQMANYNGQNVMSERVGQGNMVVIPQFFPATIKAGNEGLEFVAVKTSGTPFKSPLAGATSVFQAIPLEALSQAYQMSPEQAQQIKNNRMGETLLLSPSTRSSV